MSASCIIASVYSCVCPGSKGIRLDVYVEDEAGTVYNVEIQTTDKKNLPKRLRYYQGMIDLNILNRGEDYASLRRSFVIFICTLDFILL